MESCRVLIVEDEYFLATDLELALRTEGAEIVGPIAEVGKALEQVDRDGFDVAVLDINLRDETAYPIADKLIDEDIPFVFATGYAASVIPQQFLEVQRFEKPYSVPEIAKHVVELGRQRRRSGKT